jgi:hypothetical protein
MDFLCDLDEEFWNAIYHSGRYFIWIIRNLPKNTKSC